LARVLVVGGGVVGLTSSVVLASAGFDVVLFERGRVFGGCSGASLGILSLPLAVLDGFSVEYVRRALSLHSRFSREYGYSLLSTQVVVPLKRIRSILGEVARAIGGFRWFRVGVRRVGGLGLSLVVGDTFLVDLSEYRDSLIRVAGRLGVDIREGVGIEELVVEGGRVVGVRTSSGGVVEGDVVVVAAGVWSSRLLGSVGLELSVVPVKGYTLVVRSSSRLGFVVGVDPVFIRPHQRREDLLLVGGFKVVSGLDTSIVEEHLEEMVRVARSVGVVVEEVLEARVGLRPCLGRPLTSIVGFRNLVVSTGHCRHGVLFAPLAAVEVLGLVRRVVGSV